MAQNIQIYYSAYTFVLYILIGVFCSLWLRNTYKINNLGHYYSNKSKSQRLFGFWLILTTFAAIRLVNKNGVGGSDAYTYELMFLGLEMQERLLSTDIFFGYLITCIHYITTNPYIYRFICYGIIVYGYIVIIRRFCNEKISYIPFILLIFPYLKSFNTMRNSLAIAVFLIGVVLLANKKTLLASLIIISSVFFHRMSVLYVMFLPFYAIASKIDLNNKYKLFILLTAGVFLCYLFAIKLQAYVIAAAILEDNGSADASYIAYSVGESIFSRIPMLIQHIFLYLFLIINNDKLPETDDIKFIRLLVVFDIIVMPASVVLGMWRAVEYLYVVRLIMWGYLIYNYRACFVKHDKLIVNTIFITCFVGWLIFRINQQWESSCLMPYIPFFLV